ncbi:MAG: sugar phosphate isomerase/epimerase [Lentisphaeria bacterium]|nr:sugar phosphate isomerase/epimerase [Lentisphaeria bacterium]
MKLCMMSCMMPGAAPRTVVQTAAACGMDAIDWVCRRQYAPAKRLRSLSEDGGLKIIAHTTLDSAFVDRDPDALDDFRRSLDFACDLGAPVMMLPPFPRKGQISMEDDRKAWIDFYAQAQPLAQAAGITLTVESTGLRNSPITTAAETLEVLHAVPGLMCTLDAGNMETAEPAVNSYAVLKDYVVQFHLKDWKISDRPRKNFDLKRCGKYFADAVIGEGDLDLKAFWNTVDARGRELRVNLETTDFERRSSAAAVLKKTADLLRNW